MDFKYFRFFVLLFAFLFSFLTTDAQHTDLSIGIVPFDSKTRNINQEAITRLNRQIELALYRTRRFKMLNRQDVQTLAAVRENEKRNLDSSLDQGVAIGADYIVKGTILRYSKKKTESLRKDSIAGKLVKVVDNVYTATNYGFELKIIDVSKGSIVASSQYSGTINGINKHIGDLVRKHFPYEFHIVEILSMKSKDKAKDVLLHGGFLHGLSKGADINIYEITTEEVQGQKLKREVLIGRLNVNNLDTGGHFSKCKITKGKKEIFKKMEAGIELVGKKI